MGILSIFGIPLILSPEMFTWVHMYVKYFGNSYLFLPTVDIWDCEHQL